MSHHVTFFTRKRDNDDAYDTFWMIGNKKGVVRSRVTSVESDRDIVAELSAMYRVLIVHHVAGMDRTGRSLKLTVSRGAVKKLQKLKSQKRHLIEYGQFISTRFNDAVIDVSKKDDWISDISHIEEHCVDEPLVDNVISPYLGEIRLSYHALEQAMMFLGAGSMNKAWKTLVSILKSPRLRVAELPDHVKAHKASKYGAGKQTIYLDSKSSMQFIVAHDENTSYDTLVTVHDPLFTNK